MPFCPVPRPFLLRTPGDLPSGLARQQCLWVDALRKNGLRAFFLVLKLLFSWQSKRNQTPMLFPHQRKGSPTYLLLPVAQRLEGLVLPQFPGQAAHSKWKRGGAITQEPALTQTSPEFPGTGPQFLLQLRLQLLPCGNGWDGESWD